MGCGDSAVDLAAYSGRGQDARTLWGRAAGLRAGLRAALGAGLLVARGAARRGGLGLAVANEQRDEEQ